MYGERMHDHDTQTTTDARPSTAMAEIDLDVDVSRAWDMLTKNDLLSAWIGDGSRIEPEVGGDVMFEDVETGSRRFGTVTHVALGSKLGFIWWAENEPDGATEVTFDIEPTDDGCTIRVSETNAAATAQSGAKAAWGWRAFALATLATALVSVR